MYIPLSNQLKVQVDTDSAAITAAVAAVVPEEFTNVSMKDRENTAGTVLKELRYKETKLFREDLVRCSLSLSRSS